MTIGRLIKDRRTAKDWSLRQLAAELGVTAAYVTDLEADRRLPSAELRERISAILEIPVEELAAADSRLSSDLKTWIEDRPQVGSMLRTLQVSPEADLLIQRLSRFLKRRTSPTVPRGFLITWESELRAIGAEATAWSIETGGDLFGRWQDIPIVYLATKAGPNAQRDHAHFRLDVEYLRQISAHFASDWALRYFGDWHSHHRLGLSSPSGGDRRRVLSLASKNQFPAMTEIIVTLEDTKGEPHVRIHPWAYDLSSGESEPHSIGVKVLPGISPVREALISAKSLPEQELFAWERISLQRIRIGAGSTPPVLDPIHDVDTATREKAVAHLTRALESASGSSVEIHTTGFGSIIVARIEDPAFLAFAVSAAWPMAVLEIHKLDRNTGTTEVMSTPSGLTALDIPRLLEIYKRNQGEAHVDR